MSAAFSKAQSVKQKCPRLYFVGAAELLQEKTCFSFDL